MLAPGGVFLHNEARPILGDLTAALGLPFEQSRHAVIATVKGARAAVRQHLHSCEAVGRRAATRDGNAWQHYCGEAPPPLAHVPPSCPCSSRRSGTLAQCSVAPLDSPDTSSQCSRMSRVGRSRRAMRWSMAARATSPIWRLGCRSVVRGTGSSSAKSASSIPTSRMSSAPCSRARAACASHARRCDRSRTRSLPGAVIRSAP